MVKKFVQIHRAGKSMKKDLINVYVVLHSSFSNPPEHSACVNCKSQISWVSQDFVLFSFL